tara:strand:+ start:345 stop:1046 length:702 start_codon:yes stop_codon:yes gene_type:complete
MFKILFQIILIIYVIFLFFNILDLKKYNVNGFIKNCIDRDDILSNIMNLNPVLLHHENGYIINDVIIDHGDHIENIVLNDREHINIEGDKSLLNIINKEEIPFFPQEGGKIPLINNDSISIYKNHIGELEQCNSNSTIIYILDGDTKLYLFNPKHKDEIKDKELTTTKKWAHIKELKKGDYLIIPTNWLYFLETDKHCIIYLNKVSNIFTILPNFVRDNYKSFTLPDFISSVN